MPAAPLSGFEPMLSGTEYERLLASLRRETSWATRPVPEVTAPRAASPPPDAGDPVSWAPAWQPIDEQAASHGERVAVSQADVRLSYQDLRRRTDARAAWLAGLGIGRGDLVALLVDRGCDFAETALAIWKAGAAYLPLSPEHPEEWRADVVRRAGAVATIGRGPASAGPVHLDLDTVPPPAEAPANRTGPGDLAYVICTSGSTGEPKLVMIEHRGVTNLLHAQRAFLGDVGPDARVLQFSHPAYDAALFDVLLALPNGARLEVATASQASGGDPLADLLRERRITHAVLPAPVLRTLEPGRLPDLGMVMSIGDVCLPETARQWSPGRRLVNGYGPAEATIAATLHTASGTETETVPVGRALEGYRVHLVDKDLREVPDGRLGEICIGGVGVGRGYLGLPGLTAEHFVPDPFGAEPGGRMYRTGDHGRRLPDGSIEFAGRRDDQVKVRGARIELGQVERALAELPGVRDAVALIDGLTDRHLLGYVVPARGASLTGTALRHTIAGRLPGYLVPDVIEVLREWPLLTSGKVDRARLPRPRRPAGTGDGTAPRTPTERVLAGVAAELLGVERVGIHDDLLAAGAHSLLATQLVARVRTVLGMDVELSRVLSGATVAELAKEITERGAKVDPGPRAGDGAGELIPSYAQRRVWLMHQLNPTARAYNTQAVIRLAGDLDQTALNASLTEIVRRHDVLRSRFSETDGTLGVELEAPWEIQVPVLDLGDQDRERQAELLGDAVRDSVGRPFSLAEGRPFRWLLVRLSDNEHVFVHVEHHIVHDGWSFNVFVRDLLDGYAEFVRHGQVHRRDLAVQYYDYARWQSAWTGGEKAAAERAHWRRALDGAETVLKLPRSAGARPRTFRGAAPRIDIPADLAGRLQTLAERHDASLFTVLLSAFFVLLGRYTGSPDVLVGSGVANRRWQDTEDLLGMFVNTVVLRGRMDGDPSFGELLGRVRRMAHQVFDHQELPFEMILEESPAERRAGVNPLIQAMFSFHDSSLGPLVSAPLDVTIVEGLSNGSAKFDISVVAIPRYAEAGHISRLDGDVLHIQRSDGPVLPSPRSALRGITLAWEFDRDVLEPFLIEGMLASYRELLLAVADRPQTPISALPLLGDRERERLVTRGRGAERTGGWLPGIVARWAAETPDAPAVSSGDRPLSYQELTASAGRLAQRLHAAGVGHEDVVAVCAPHSAAVVVAQLGVLSARAAYLPLDPAHPDARLGWLVEDAGASALVTTAELSGRVPRSAGLPVLIVDEVGAVADGARLAQNDLPEGEPSDLAYVFYTSGSTGEPKGVQVEHRSVAARLRGEDVIGLRPGHRVLAIASTAFDASVLEIWGPLLNGAAIHFHPPGWTVSGLARLITGQRLTHMFLTTAVFHQFVRQESAALRGMDRVLAGGDVMSAEAFREARRQGINGLFNVYGPTETTVVVTGQRAADWVDTGGSNVPIGTPLGATHLVILDENLRPVPPGVVGEICIGGAGVARGYRGSPGLTAERFVPDPFAAEPGGRLYRSGDLGRLLPDGAIEFAGRRDDQVKIRGFRVEPGEVRAVLRARSDVDDALVVTDRDGPADRRLIAYVIPAEGHAPSGAGLREALARDLPGHLVPSVIVLVAAWPLSSGGKIDRMRLPAAEADTGTTYTAPRDDDEAALVSIAAEILEVDRIGVDDDLFELGLHSMQAMRFASRATARLGRDVGLRDVFDHPTIARLAAALTELPAATSPIGRLPRSSDDGRAAR